MRLLVAIAFVLLTCSQTTNAEGWRGIVPLQSKRADVERVLGPPKNSCSCTGASQTLCQCGYDTDDGLVRVLYSTSPCSGYPSGWNVPPDTVLMISINWDEPPKFSELQLTLSQFDKAADDTLTRYYSSREKGVQYSVSWDQKVLTTSYIPTRKDVHLRCSCFPLLDESTQRSVHFDEFGLGLVDEALGRLDSNVIALSKNEHWIGYVIVYKGKSTTAKASLRYRQAITRHLFETRGQPRDRVVIVDGGYRDEPYIEVFLLSRELTPPEPRATWKPCRGKDSGRTDPRF